MAASNGFMYHLSVAACEWFLMFLMFLDAALAFILTKFAHHCELQSPCIFCLRLDHVFGNEKPGSYLSLFCHKHRAEISCLVSCELHDKLADVRELCDDCFISVMIQNQSNGRSYGKEGLMGMKGYKYQKPLSTGTCSCCEKTWTAKPTARRFIPPGLVRFGVPRVNMKPPLPQFVGCDRLDCRGHFKRSRDKVSVNSSPCHVENSIVSDVDVDMDALSDSGFADARFYSDSESEVSFYEDDDTTSKVAVIGGKTASEDDSSFIHVTDEQNQYQSGVEHLRTVSAPESSLLDGHYESIKSPLSLASNGSIGHGVEESNHIEHQSTAVSALSVSQDINNTSDHRKLSSENLEENSPPELIEETQALPSKSDEINDHEAASSSDKSETYESPGGASSVSEIEGESVVDKLKRQVEYDRERMRLLNAELEEERNAAAIAADEAMAMITRLQEEKSALHTEALQYLRMMDEQAEYDMEALEKANDLIAEKDKEIQDLEAELEYFRSRYDDELMMGNSMVENEDLRGEYTGNGKTDVNSSSDLKFSNGLEPQPKSVSANPPTLGFEDEKKYILRCLSDLEKKFHKFSSEHKSIRKSNGDVHDRTTHEVDNQDHGTQSDHLKDESSLSRHQDSSTTNGSKKRFSADDREVDANTLEDEISNLYERLEALEADRNFLEHACNMIQDNGGLEFIQEIAHHLHDLRRTRFDTRCQSVA